MKSLFWFNNEYILIILILIVPKILVMLQGYLFKKKNRLNLKFWNKLFGDYKNIKSIWYIIHIMIIIIYNKVEVNI